MSGNDGQEGGAEERPLARRREDMDWSELCQVAPWGRAKPASRPPVASPALPVEPPPPVVAVPDPRPASQPSNPFEAFDAWARSEVGLTSGPVWPAPAGSENTRPRPEPEAGRAACFHEWAGSDAGASLPDTALADVVAVVSLAVEARPTAAVTAAAAVVAVAPEPATVKPPIQVAAGSAPRPEPASGSASKAPPRQAVPEESVLEGVFALASGVLKALAPAPAKRPAKRRKTVAPAPPVASPDRVGMVGRGGGLVIQAVKTAGLSVFEIARSVVKAEPAPARPPDGKRQPARADRAPRGR